MWKTCSSKHPSVFDASFTSCSSDNASSKALKAQSVVTAVILRIPLAIPSSDKRANALASRVFDMWVPRYINTLTSIFNGKTPTSGTRSYKEKATSTELCRNWWPLVIFWISKEILHFLTNWHNPNWVRIDLNQKTEITKWRRFVNHV